MSRKNRHNRERTAALPPTPKLPSTQENATEATCKTKPRRYEQSIAEQLKEIFRPNVAKLGLGTAVIVAVIYFFQMRTMQRQLGEMQVQTRLSVRPWVGLEDSMAAIQATPLRFDEKGNGSLLYRLSVKNYSTVAAVHVYALADLLVNEDMPTIQQTIDGLCGEPAVGNPQVGFVLWPGKLSVYQEMPTVYDRGRMVSKTDDGKYEAWLAGCIGFRDQFDYFYTSSFLYWLVDPTTDRVLRIDATPNTEVTGKWQAYGGSVSTGMQPKKKQRKPN